jgi:uncharacterized protein (DUF433 family)
MKLDVVDTYIEEDPYKPGPVGARLRSTGVPIWALISYYRRAVHEDVEQTARDYELPREAVEAALEYYRQHKELLDARITLNSSSVA